MPNAKARLFDEILIFWWSLDSNTPHRLSSTALSSFLKIKGPSPTVVSILFRLDGLRSLLGTSSGFRLQGFVILVFYLRYDIGSSEQKVRAFCC